MQRFVREMADILYVGVAVSVGVTDINPRTDN